MKFFRYLTAALLPVFAFATPSLIQLAAEPNQVQPRAPATSDITSLLGNIIPDIQALTSLHDPTVISDIKVVVVGLATVFSGDTANQTKTLISEASGLLTPDLVKSVSGLLPSVTSLLTSDTIKEIGTLLTNANNLLTDKFVSQVTELINDVAPLVSAVAQVITTLISAVLGG
ncbi:hypothetical protein K432DRAFT_443856 [Lepidopterella palustris CBS 459.81]|uniref:Uncharacterized protein n=1 Tax=Lepidopterella palustris CBS 459.81 TaxID=1314670 RepID=A0A8E2JEX0_9PEZI|nr:hypothetical protein K432DRAFT_443856 [Lepidopterella palustris CBS 459.81]